VLVVCNAANQSKIAAHFKAEVDASTHSASMR
jgi:hypothetical protein